MRSGQLAVANTLSPTRCRQPAVVNMLLPPRDPNSMCAPRTALDKLVGPDRHTHNQRAVSGCLARGLRCLARPSTADCSGLWRQSPIARAQPPQTGTITRGNAPSPANEAIGCERTPSGCGTSPRGTRPPNRVTSRLMRRNTSSVTLGEGGISAAFGKHRAGGATSESLVSSPRGR